jgi:PAS domain S-box-containing protein
MYRLPKIGIENLSYPLHDRIESFEQREADLKKELEITRQENARWSNFMEKAHDIIYRTDADGYFTYTNPASERIMGYASEEIIGRHYLEMVRPDYHEKAVHLYGKQFSYRISDTYFELPLMAKNGREIWVGQHVQLLITAEQITGFQAIARDNTEQKRSKEELESSLSLLSASLDSTADGLLIVDREGRINRWNRNFAAMWKIPEGILAGRNDDQALNYVLKQLSDPEKFIAKVIKLYSLPEESSFDQITFLDGRVFERYSQPQKLEDEIVGRVWSFRDITEHKQDKEKLQCTLDKLREALGGIIQVVSQTVEKRDPYTAGHQRRVSELARTIAKEMGFTSDQVDGLRLAGIIHDLGKISVPAEILSKPDKLTELEFELIKLHPQSGYDILKNVDFPWPIARIVLEHHERIDGSGYPKGLKGEDLLPETKVLVVADVVEAIASHRPYRPALGVDKALEEIKKNSGIHYDPKVVETCIKLFVEKGYKFK